MSDEVLDKDELNRDLDLALADRTMGPLVFPGPSLTAQSVTPTQLPPPSPQVEVEVEVEDADREQTSTSEPNTVLV